MTQADWPSYRVGNADHLDALGVIAAVFSHLEFHFRSIFHLYTRLPTEVAYTLFGKISNELRLEIARQAIDHSPHPDALQENVRHFLAGFRAASKIETYSCMPWRKLVYIVAFLWVAAFIWQTIAHANPPFPFDHNGSLMELWPESTNGG